MPAIHINETSLLSRGSIRKTLSCVNQTFSIIGDNFQIGIDCEIHFVVLNISAFWLVGLMVRLSKNPKTLLLGFVTT